MIVDSSLFQLSRNNEIAYLVLFRRQIINRLQVVVTCVAHSMIGSVIPRSLAIRWRVEHLVHCVQSLLLHFHQSVLFEMHAHTHLAQVALAHQRALVTESHIALPGEILVVRGGIGVQIEQVVGEKLGRVEIERVYEARPRHIVVVVVGAQYHRHDVISQQVEELLGDVVAAHRVLEREVESHTSGYERTTIGLSVGGGGVHRRRTHVRAVAAFAIDVNRCVGSRCTQMLVEYLQIGETHAFVVAVAYECGSELFLRNRMEVASCLLCLVSGRGRWRPVETRLSEVDGREVGECGIVGCEGKRVVEVWTLKTVYRRFENYMHKALVWTCSLRNEVNRVAQVKEHHAALAEHAAIVG